jgi:hypothetical protein
MSYLDAEKASKEPPCDMAFTVMWPAFRLTPEDLAAVLPGAIHDRGFFRVLEDRSVMAMRPKDTKKPKDE